MTSPIVSRAKDVIGPASGVLLLMMLTGPPRLVARDPMASMRGELNGAVVLNVLGWGVAALWAFNEFNRYALKERRLPAIGLYEALAFMLPLAVAPSLIVSSSRLLSLYRLAQAAIGIAFGSFWVRRYGVARTLRLLQAGLWWLCVVSAVLYVLVPSWVVFGGRLFGGAFVSVSAVGSLAFAGAIAGGRQMCGRWYVPTLVLSVILIGLSQTRSAFGAILLVLLVAGVRSADVSVPRRIGLLLLGGAPIAFMLGWGERVLGFVVRDANSLSTLSDRMPLWQRTVEVVWAVNPLIGLGYFTSRLVTLSFNDRIGGAHNVVVEVFAGAGLVGVAGLVIAVGPLLWRLTRVVLTGRTAPAASVLTAWGYVLVIQGMFSEDVLYSTTAGLIAFMLPALLTGVLREWGEKPPARAAPS